jgi:hypothetical protein
VLGLSYVWTRPTPACPTSHTRCTTATSSSPPAAASACIASASTSQPCAGQRLGIKEVDDGIWIVSFMHYDLGFIDLEQKTLQPLDNPFGIGLSPMS